MTSISLISKSRETQYQAGTSISISLGKQYPDTRVALRALSPTQSLRPSGSSTLISRPEQMARRSEGMLCLAIPVSWLISSRNLVAIIVARQHKAGTFFSFSVISSQPSPVNFIKASVNPSFSRWGRIWFTNEILKLSSFCVVSFSPASVEPIRSMERQKTNLTEFSSDEYSRWLRRST